MERPSELPLGTPLPPLNPHSITVSIPTWRDAIAYQEADPHTLQCLRTGYPRFVINALIVQLSEIYLHKEGKNDEECMLFPTASYAKECTSYILAQAPHISQSSLHQEQFTIHAKRDVKLPSIDLYVVVFPSLVKKIAGRFWQHTGFGISSRLAQKCLDLLGVPPILPKSRYGIPSQWQTCQEGEFLLSSSNRGVSEDFNKPSAVRIPFSPTQAKADLRRRIADFFSYVEFSEQYNVVREDDVFLYPTGMAAIWHAHKLLITMCPETRFVCFGFPYTDTLKILEKWGPGCHFYGHDRESDMKKLEDLLSSSQSIPPISALFCEITSNPLLQSPPFDRLRELADKYDFLIVVDDTIGTSLNVNVLPYADIIATSLSKFVCGYANALGGSLVFNPCMRHYHQLKEAQMSSFVDVYFDEDARVMEKNSRDFVTRMHIINANANALCKFLHSRSLLSSPMDEKLVLKEIFYPKWTSRVEYDICRVKNRRDGQPVVDNFGGLFSLTFVTPLASHVFLDALPCAKGPSLGTNFTLACPYTILAHFAERDWAAEYGVEEDLVRVSVGLEDQKKLLKDFEFALGMAEAAASTEPTLNQ